jgi:hypothetical protein
MALSLCSVFSSLHQSSTLQSEWSFKHKSDHVISQFKTFHWMFPLKWKARPLLWSPRPPCDLLSSSLGLTSHYPLPYSFCSSHWPRSSNTPWIALASRSHIGCPICLRYSSSTWLCRSPSHYLLLKCHPCQAPPLVPMDSLHHILWYYLPENFTATWPMWQPRGERKPLELGKLQS